MTSTHKYPRHDHARIAGVVKSIDETSGLIRIGGAEGIDLPFLNQDVLGSAANMRPGQTVTLIQADDAATLICNIHDDESVQALIDHQSPVYA